MNISKKLKSYTLIGGLAVFGALGSASFGFKQSDKSNDNTQLVNQARTLDANSVRLAGLGQNGSLFNTVLRDVDDNFITAANGTIIKLDSFTKPLYGLDLSDDFAGYKVKQIVSDYTTSRNRFDQRQTRAYYALLVNDEANVHLKRINTNSNRIGNRNNNSKFVIGGVDNPAHVIRFTDDGTKFNFTKQTQGEIVNDFILDAPILPKDLHPDWYNLYIQRKILPNDVNTAVVPWPVGRVSGTNADDGMFDFGNGQITNTDPIAQTKTTTDNQNPSTFNSGAMPGANNRYDSQLNVKHRIKTSFQLDEKFVYPEWTGSEENKNITRLATGSLPSNERYWILDIPGTPQVTLKEDSVNVFSRLYLNSVNSLSFIGDSIYIFGTSELPSLWYYSFPTRLSDLTALNQVKTDDIEASSTDNGTTTNGTTTTTDTSSGSTGVGTGNTTNTSQTVSNPTLNTYRSFGIDSKPTSANKIDETNWADPNVIEARIYAEYRLGIQNEIPITNAGNFIRNTIGGVGFTSTGSRVVLRASYNGDQRPTGNFQPFLYVFGYLGYQQTRAGTFWYGTYKLLNNSPYDVLDAARVGTETNQFRRTSLTYPVMGGYLTEEGARSFSNTPYIRAQGDTPESRSIFQSGYSDNTYEYIQSVLGFDGIRNNLNVGVKASSFLNSNRPNPNGLEMIAATTYLRSQIGLARTSGLPNQQPFGTTHQVISVSPGDQFSSIKNIRTIFPGNQLWYFLFTNENNKSSVYTLRLADSSNPDASSSFSPTSLIDVNEIGVILPLLNNSFYTVNAAGNVALFSSNPGSPGSYTAVNTFNQNLSDIAFEGSGAKYTSDFWGTIQFKPDEYLIQNGFTSQVARNFVTNQSFLNSLVDFTPANAGTNYRVVVDPDGNLTNQNLPLKVQIQYLDGKYYDAKLKNNNLVAFSYNNFAALPSWVVPTAIGSTLGILAIMIILGLAIGIPLRAQRKLQDKGFKTTFKKVDTLTAAVGSVYKKIITQTANVKKKPAALGAGKSGDKKPAAAKPGAPAKPSAPKASSPAKPTAPKSGAPTKPTAPKSAAPKPTAPKE